MAKIKNVKCLDDYIKAYNKRKEADEFLEYAKIKVIEHLKDCEQINKTYKGKLFSLCEKKTFEYSPLAIEMAEAAAKQREIDKLTDAATLINTTEYIRLSEAKNDDK